MSVRKRGNHWESLITVEKVKYFFNFNGKDGQPLITTKSEALTKQEEIRRQILTGTFLKDTDLKNFKKFFDEVYMEYSNENKTPLAQDVDEQFGRHLITAFGDKNLREISARSIERFINEMLRTNTKFGKPFSPVTVRRMYNILNQMFGMAIRERIINENPCQYVSREIIKKIPAWLPRDRWLNKFDPIEIEDEDGNKKLMTEEERLFEAFRSEGEHLAAIAMIMLNTGIRPGELLRVKKDHVNLCDKARWHKIGNVDILLPVNSLLVERGKSGKPRVIPLNKKARLVLRVLINNVTTDEWLFTNRNGEPMKSVKRGFARSFQRAGLNGLRSYDMRHSFSTRLLERGVHQFVISSLLGHELHGSGFSSGSRMTAGYSHVTWDLQVNAVKSLEMPAPSVEHIYPMDAENNSEFDKSLTNDEKLRMVG